jgi:hypothetical protein
MWRRHYSHSVGVIITREAALLSLWMWRRNYDYSGGGIIIIVVVALLSL